MGRNQRPKVRNDGVRKPLTHRKLVPIYRIHVPIDTDINDPARQEKLLQGLMSEIVRMTTQKEPLQVGIPLYPFSHERVFANAAEDAAASAPLPSSSPFEGGSPPPSAPPPPSIHMTADWHMDTLAVNGLHDSMLGNATMQYAL